uniref:PB1 domain-containing protein n=1 Tax=Caenorhabditis japonica TaxID=281687 RepID=A0A8R1E1V7_CAEJA
MFSGGSRKVKWNHFGKKYALRFSDYEMEYADLYDALLKKVHEVRPDFEGDLAFIDQYGRQVIVSSDKDVREAIQQSKNKLKLHTTLRDGHVIAAADMAEAARGRPTRSQSVPPGRSYNAYPQRSPSSMESAPDTYRHHQITRAMSPPARSTTTTTGTAHSPPMRQIGETVKTTYHHSGNYGGLYPGGYKGYPYGGYSNNILYGMPPHNGMLWRFLANPFPFGNQHRSFIGPNKYHHFGGYNHMYSSGLGGPVW